MGVHTTVVFADLMGSTGLFEATGNAKASRAVTGLTQWMCEVFVAHGGRIVKTLGDGVFAVFPTGAAAITAVVEIQRIHQKQHSGHQSGMNLPIRVGVASGEVEFISGDCYGDAVNLAARLSDLSGPNQIWAASNVVLGVDEAFGVRFRPLGPIVIRGRTEACPVHQVEWRVDEHTDFLTQPADFGAAIASSDFDALGGQIDLSWLDMRKAFKSFEMPFYIGRGSQAGFAINDPRVSREHARIEWRNGSVMIVDISTYGCWLRFSGGGADLMLRRDECVLHGQGEIALGASFADISVPTVAFSVV
jgi:adenylate cyclase